MLWSIRTFLVISEQVVNKWIFKIKLQTVLIYFTLVEEDDNDIIMNAAHFASLFKAILIVRTYFL